MSFTFGAAQPAAATGQTAAAPLFGSTTAANAAPAASATTATPLFGAAPSTATAGGGLFGSTATATGTTVGGLFGFTTTTAAAKPAATAAGGLFGTAAAPATATTTGGGLFGAAAGTSAATTTGGLFGATTTAPATSLGLAGTAAATAPTGLGGSAVATGSLNLGGTVGVAGTAQAEKENIREGEVPAPIMELLKAVQAKYKENKDRADEFQKCSSEGVKMIKFRLKEVDHLISDGVSAVASRDRQTVSLSAKVTKDCRLGKEAQAVQETLARSHHQHSSVAQQHVMQHIVSLIREYEQQILMYQEIIEQMTVRIRDILQGQGQLTTAELKEYLSRFDVIFSSVANKLFEANSKVEELRSQLNADDQQRVKEAKPAVASQGWAQYKAPSAFPSQAVLTQIGAMLKPQAAAATTTGTGLFGSTGTAGTSLFGSTTAAKPLFGSTTATTGGSLFPSLTTGTATTAAQPASAGSLFPSLTSTPARPATSFGSTLSTNTTGLLFSSKK